MRIGFSLFWQLILGQADPNNPHPWGIALPDVNAALDQFKNIGISSIELKLTEKFEIGQVAKAIEILAAKGFNITFHAPGRFRYPEDLPWQLDRIAEISRFIHSQFQFIPLWVIHPLNSKTQERSSLYSQTVDYLQQIIASLDNMPVRLAVEILRNRKDSEKINIGDSYQEILQILTDIGNDDLGICWDFGHAFAMHERNLQAQFPPAEFLNRVSHCHVHDSADQKTHLPVGAGNIPVQEYIYRLKEVGFSGILNLEVVPHRVDDPENFMNYVKNNVKMIQQWIG